MKKKKYEEEIEILDQWDFPEEDVSQEDVDKFSQLVGEFMMKFSIVERDLNIAISEIVSQRGHELGLVIVSQLRLVDKVNLFSKLYLPLISSRKIMHASGLTEVEALKKISTDLKDLIDFRNRIAHADWSSIDKRGFVRSKITSNDSGAVQFVRFKVTFSLLKERIKQVKFLDLDINEFYNIALGH